MDEVSDNSDAVRILAHQLHEAFVLTLQEAAEYAKGIHGLIHAYGGDPAEVDAFERAVRLHGEKLIWRSETERQAWLARREATVTSYNAYINHKRQSPFKKW